MNFLDHPFGKQFWINILLTILGYIPGIVHAVWVIAKYQSDQLPAPGLSADSSDCEAIRLKRCGERRRSSAGRQP
jgi:TRAP-type mannitol/chloroaromatic compound transport system permease small subunit